MQYKDSPFSFSIKTMGCKANIYDSLVLEKELQELGGARNDDTPDLFVLNSCTVTAEADKQCHREVTALKKRSPKSWSVVTGCYAQVSPKSVAADPNVDLAITNTNKFNLKKIVAERFNITVEHEKTQNEVYWGQLPSYVGKTRAFIKIQEGCNDYCTYCIIPFARGKSRSVRTGDILSEVTRLTETGIKEVVITGTNIADFGKDSESSLEDLLETILARTPIGRIRLTSLDPSEITDRILNLIEPNGRLMPHFHVSLQSPVSRVLRAMKRDYRTEEVISALNKIHSKSPDIFVGMDVITGFPSETESEHNEALSILTDLPWSRLHVFPYSEREGTSALKIAGSVPYETRKHRSKELMNLSLHKHKRFVESFFNRTANGVLFETIHEAEGEFFVIGHAENYLRVMAKAGNSRSEAQSLLNTARDVAIHSAVPNKSLQDWTLEGSLL